MFKKTEFTGDSSHNINEAWRMYDICFRQYHLSRAQRTDVFVHSLDGAAHKFLLDEIPNSTSYSNIVHVKMHRVNSILKTFLRISLYASLWKK